MQHPISLQEISWGFSILNPWRAIIGTRDRLIHGYASVNLDILWAILMDDLPQLIDDLTKVIESEE